MAGDRIRLILNSQDGVFAEDVEFLQSATIYTIWLPTEHGIYYHGVRI